MACETTKYYGDYHTHSTYSDATASLRDNFNQAIKIGLKEIAVTDHGFNNPTLSLTRKKLKKQQLEIIKLREEFSNLSILSGIEANLISLDGTVDLKMDEFEQFDIVVAGFHYFSYPKTVKDFFKMYLNTYKGLVLKKHTVSDTKIKDNTNAYIKAIKKYPIDIISHINNFCMVNVVEVCKACYDYGTMIELNSKHINIGLDEFEDVLKTNVQIIANTDCHKANRVGNFSRIEEFLNNFNLPLDILTNYNKKPTFRKGR